MTCSQEQPTYTPNDVQLSSITVVIVNPCQHPFAVSTAAHSTNYARTHLISPLRSQSVPTSLGASWINPAAPADRMLIICPINIYLHLLVFAHNALKTEHSNTLLFCSWRCELCLIAPCVSRVLFLFPSNGRHSCPSQFRHPDNPFLHTCQQRCVHSRTSLSSVLYPPHPHYCTLSSSCAAI